jgi:hypothetical protein
MYYSRYLYASVRTNDHAYVMRGSSNRGYSSEEYLTQNLRDYRQIFLLINLCLCLKQNDVCWSDARALSVNALPLSLDCDVSLSGL